MNYIIRKSKKEDCFDIANVVTVSWNETYKWIVPDWFLEELYKNEDERAKRSYDKFDERDNNQLVLEIDNKVVGFVKYGESYDDSYNKCGEIFALYIVGKYHGYGYGRKLVNAASLELKKLGFDKMIIGCLKGNPSNKFYEYIGGKQIKDGVYKKLNLPENIYYYEKI